MKGHEIQTCEALLIKKTPIGESDILATLFTRESGKIKAIAKGATSSRKRFGGGFELFAVLKIEIGATRSGGKILQNSVVSSSFRRVAENMGVFLKANCLIDFIDAAFPEEQIPNETVFNEAVKALSAMNAGDGICAMFGFQTAVLESLGYSVDLSRCGECGGQTFENGHLIFPSGVFLCGSCARKSEGKPARKISRTVEAGRGAALRDVNCLNAFFQYQTGAVLKSAKVLENMLSG
ncbi:MAG: DNA repair protein RecO [Candidatus Mycalebacterium zealandia]|nr:MAG: DNA repair protein RecO [Candidatus Mycalebacterium zealandia]